MVLLAFAETIQLFPDGTIFIHILMILGMIWILNRTFFRPIYKVIESRESSKGGYGSEAEKILADVNEKEARLNKAMLDARSAGYELIEKERAAAVDYRANKLAEAKAETADRLAAEKARIAAEKETARAQVAAEAEVLAEKISSSVLSAKG